MDIYIARQPIFDQHMRLYGYELLYRKSANNFYEGVDHSGATAEVVHNTFLVIGFNDLIDGTRGFINFTQDLLESELPHILPKDQVVVEILENVEANDSVVVACRKLKSLGYTIALDDFVLNRTDHDYTPLIELADIIKVEFPCTDKKEQRKLLSKYKKDIIFLAEKVETREEYQEAVEMGYQLFQGYFFSKPLMVSSKEIVSLNIHLLNLLKELYKEEPDYGYITATIEKDLGLSYKLLKMANSIYFGGEYTIHSLRQAVARLGLLEMKRWIAVMLIKEVQTDENNELVKICLLRGKVLSLIAKELGVERLESDYFLTGILSSIDVLLNNKMEKILASLPLTAEVKSALLGEESQLKGCLDGILLYEKFELDLARTKLGEMNLTLERYMDLYMDALSWLRETNG